MNDCNPQGIKILVSDYKLGHQGYIKHCQDKHIRLIDELADKRLIKSVWNLWHIFGVPTRQEVLKDIATDVIEYKGIGLGNNDISIIVWEEPDYDKLKEAMRMTTIIQDKYMWVDIYTADFVAKYRGNKIETAKQKRIAELKPIFEKKGIKL